MSDVPIPFYLQKYEEECTKEPTEISKFCSEVEKITEECDKDLGNSPPLIDRDIWKRRKGECATLRKWIKFSKIRLDDTPLVNFCEVIGWKKLPFGAKYDELPRALRSLVNENNSMSHQAMNKNGNSEQILRTKKENQQLKEEKEELLKKNQKLVDSNNTKNSLILDQDRKLTEMEELRKQNSNTEQRMQEYERVIEQYKKQEKMFGETLIATVEKKERDLEEEYKKNLQLELEKQNTAFQKELCIKQALLDELKMKNVEWGIERFKLMEQLNALERRVVNSPNGSTPNDSHTRQTRTLPRPTSSREPEVPSYDDLHQRFLQQQIEES